MRFNMHWLLPFLLLVGSCLAGAGEPADAPKTISLVGPSSSAMLAKQYPTTNLRITLLVTYRKPGVIFDSVGINAAPAGSCSMSVDDKGRVTFQIYAPALQSPVRIANGWHLLTSDAGLRLNTPGEVSVDVLAKEVVLSIDGKAIRRVPLAVTLSGQPLYAGDFPGDDAWGPKYNIHPAMTGEITLIYLGPPSKAELVTDETDTLTTEQRARLVTELQTLRERHGLTAAVVFIKQATLPEAQARADEYQRNLTAAGILPARYAIFLYAGDTRTYKRSVDFDKVVSLDTVKKAWESAPAQAALPDRVAAFLGAVNRSLSGNTGASADPSTPLLLKPGAVLAEGKVGIGGGRVSAKDAVTVEFPAGALAREERVVIHAGEGAPASCGFVFIEREGKELFRKPVRVGMHLPAGVDAAKVVSLHQVTGNTWSVEPAAFDAATRMLTIKVNHFSGSGWIDTSDRKTWLFGGAGLGFLGSSAGFGTYVILTGGSILSAPISIPAAAVVVVCTLGGWGLGDVAYDAYRERGLVGPYPANGFDILWDPKTVPGKTSKIAVVNKKTGKLLGMFAPDRLSDAIGQPGNTGIIELPDGSGVALSDMEKVELPETIERLAAQLQAARTWYGQAGYKTPEKTVVMVHTAIEGGNAGEWDGKRLNLNPGSLSNLLPASGGTADEEKARKEQRANFLATIAHEYWHAIFAFNGYREQFSGADDCLATTYETVVFLPSSNEFLLDYPWKKIAPFLANGINQPGADEGLDDVRKRGYRLWPWGKYLFHTQGNGEMQALAERRQGGDVLSKMYIGFTRSLLVRDQALDDPAQVDQADGKTGDAITGWKSITAVDLTGGKPNIKPGRFDIGRARSLSLRLQAIELAKRPAEEAPLSIVVRRAEPDTIEQVVFLKPPVPGAEIALAATLDDIITGDGGAVAGKDWVDSAAADLLLPVALVGTATEPAPQRINPLFIYRLTAPTEIKITPLPAPPGGKPEEARTKLEWKLPALGANIRIQDVLAGYRLYGKDKSNRETLIAELLLDPAAIPQAPAGWYRGAGGFSVKITPDQLSVEIPADKTADMLELGLASIDSMLRDHGQPVCSEINWKSVVDIVAALQRTNTVAARFTAPHTWEWKNSHPDARVKSGTNRTEEVSWTAAGGYPPTPSVQWTGREFSFTYDGPINTSADVFESPSAHGASTVNWKIAITGSVDARGNLVTATVKATQGGYSVDTIQFTLTNLAPTTLNISDKAVRIVYYLTGPTVKDHVTVLGASRVQGTVTTTYTGTDWAKAGARLNISLDFSLVNR